MARVSSLFADPDTARSMGIAGQRFVKDTFSYPVITEKWERLLNEVLSSAVPNYAEMRDYAVNTRTAQHLPVYG